MGWFSSIVNAVTSFVSEVATVINATLSRISGIPLALLELFGILPNKTIRIKVVVLKDGDDNIVTREDAMVAVEFAKLIFKERANVNVVPAGSGFIRILDTPAPEAALKVNCDAEAWADDFREAGAYFRRYTERGFLGYAIPVTIFVVREFYNADDLGCSLGPLTNYVTVSKKGIIGNPYTSDDVAPPSATLAHEIGHACGLWHLSDRNNLMCTGRNRIGLELKKWQVTIFRNSSHVTLI